MQSPHLEKIFYHVIIKDKDLLNLVPDKFFESDFISNVYSISKEFVEKFSKPPTLKQLVEIAKGKSLIEEKEDVTKFKLLYKVDLNEYDSDWLISNVRAWIEFKNLDSSVLDVLTYLKTTTVSIDNIGEIVETVKEIINTRNQITFDFDEGLNFFDVGSHEQIEGEYFTTGYKYLDTVLGGGWSAKKLFVLVGQNKVGKCVVGETKIRIRNKKTGVIELISIQDFFKKIKTNES